MKKWMEMVLLMLTAALCIACMQPGNVQAGGTQAEKERSAETQPENVETGSSELDNLRRQTEEALLEEFDFGELDQSLKEMFPQKKIRFQEVFSSLIEGNLSDTAALFAGYVTDCLSYEFANNRKNLVYIVLIAVIAAVFTNFSDALNSRQVSRISFYVLYLLLITMCLQTFRVAMAGLEEQIAKVIQFMQILCPVYFLSVAVSAGTGSAVMFYNLALFLIYLVEAVILHMILPAVHVYIMLQVMNYLLGEDTLTEFADLLKKLVTWGLKTMFAAVIGINVIQGLLGPSIDELKRSTLTKTVEAIPGIGNTFGSVTDVVLGTAVLLKNGVGMAGALMLILFCVTPVIQMLILCLMFKLTAALVQPVSDERITGCIRSVSEGYELMLRILITVAVLFLLTIAVAAASTS